MLMRILRQSRQDSNLALIPKADINAEKQCSSKSTLNLFLYIFEFFIFHCLHLKPFCISLYLSSPWKNHQQKIGCFLFSEYLNLWLIFTLFVCLFLFSLVRTFYFNLVHHLSSIRLLHFFTTYERNEKSKALTILWTNGFVDFQIVASYFIFCFKNLLSLLKTFV